jgi:extracellular factor (EF) 3-hydroxypalmitic acid methyl ester biosynthesis protein
LIEQGQIPVALPMLAGKLHNAHADVMCWDETRASFHRHPLHAVLMEDPYTAHCVAKPRGYAGDAALIDIIYDRKVPQPVTGRAAELFSHSIAFTASEAVRLRREYAETQVARAWQAGKRVCVLACGHFREGDSLIGEDMSNIVVIDQDPLSLEVVRRNHGQTMACIEANVFKYLRSAVARGEKFDLIYTLGLTDYLDNRAMQLLHKMMKSCLAPGGTMLLANFMPDHLATGWMDAVMDWHLIYRTESELAGFAQNIGLTPKTWIDPTKSIAWCEMQEG